MTVMTLNDAISALDDGDDAHWNKGGQPNLNVLKEATGHPVSRETQEDAYDRRRTIADDDVERASQDVADNATVPVDHDDPGHDYSSHLGKGGQFISLGGGKRKPAPAT